MVGLAVSIHSATTRVLQIWQVEEEFSLYGKETHEVGKEIEQTFNSTSF